LITCLSEKRRKKYQLDQVSVEVERKMVVEMTMQEGDVYMIVGKTGTRNSA
jgi:uncharacterized protein YaeQ